MKDLLEYIVKNLVSQADKVTINEEESEAAINFNLTLDPIDMGIVIGKGGQTIRAIRKLLIVRAMAENQNLRVNVDVQEA